MQQITRAIYIVGANEEVTVEIEATKVGNFATFALSARAPADTGRWVGQEHLKSCTM